MPRTLNPETYTVKRDVFVDVAQLLITTRGYASFSVQDVLDAANASKGAFYHYFDAKDQLVDAVVNRMADQAAATVQPILDDPDRSAVDKLEALFRGMAQFKAERKDLVLGILRIWLSDDNLVVREKLRRIVVLRLVPWLEGIVRQGVAEGTFTSHDPDRLARVLATLVQGMSELASELWVARQSDTVSLEEVQRTFAAYQEAFERIVGVPSGTLRFLDEQTVEFWFG
jgi:AcrR family transcriptional regulator